MTAYWIAHVTVTDPVAYEGYPAIAPAAFAKFGARFLAHGGEARTLEGPEFTRHVVIAFEDLATAQACYDSPDYQAARSMRAGACEAQVVIVAGVTGQI